VADLLRHVSPELRIEIVAIRTSGDRLATAHLAEIGGKGLFVREIDEALLAGHVDLAVHSLKDLPVERPAGLVLAALPPRGDVRDALVADPPRTLATLASGTRVGSSSPRRTVQLLAARPDVVAEPIRGNVDTRLRKLRQGEYGAILLAMAGLRRLGLVDAAVVPLSPEAMLPAAGQGTLAVETRASDARVRELAGRIDDAETRRATVAERAFLDAVGGSCAIPLAAYARPEGAGLRLDVFLSSSDGARILRDGEAGEPGDADALGRRVAVRLLRAGAEELLAAGRIG
jgi:hydroxymethylbilane synthase